MVTMTRERESIAPATSLLMAFELGQRSWKLGFSTGVGHRPRVRQVPAGATAIITQEILRAKVWLGPHHRRVQWQSSLPNKGN